MELAAALARLSSRAHTVVDARAARRDADKRIRHLVIRLVDAEIRAWVAVDGSEAAPEGTGASTSPGTTGYANIPRCWEQERGQGGDEMGSMEERAEVPREAGSSNTAGKHGDSSKAGIASNTRNEDADAVIPGFNNGDGSTLSQNKTDVGRPYDPESAVGIGGLFKTSERVHPLRQRSCAHKESRGMGDSRRGYRGVTIDLSTVGADDETLYKVCTRTDYVQEISVLTYTFHFTAKRWRCAPM